MLPSARPPTVPEKALWNEDAYEPSESIYMNRLRQGGFYETDETSPLSNSADGSLGFLWRIQILYYGILSGLWISSLLPLQRLLSWGTHHIGRGGIYRGWDVWYHRQRISALQIEYWCSYWKYCGTGIRAAPVSLLDGALLSINGNHQRSWRTRWPWRVGYWWVPGYGISGPTLHLLIQGTWRNSLGIPPHICTWPYSIFQGKCVTLRWFSPAAFKITAPSTWSARLGFLWSPGN